jgi:hypothetical protein
MIRKIKIVEYRLKEIAEELKINRLIKKIKS